MARVVQGVLVGGVLSILLAAACSGDDSSESERVGGGATGGSGAVGYGGGAADASIAVGGGTSAAGAIGVGGSGGGGPSGGTGTGGTGTGGGLGTGGTGGPPPCVGETPVGGTDPLIDDLEDGDSRIAPVDGRTGFWYTHNDGTGTQNPPPDAFVPEGPDAGANGTDYAAHTMGQGFMGSASTYGIQYASMGVNLNTTATYCAYDASAFTGITFWAKGAASGEQEVRLSLFTSDTLHVNFGGTCEVGCNDHYGAVLTLGSDWEQFTCAWSDFAQRNWESTLVDFDPATLFAIAWELQGTVAEDRFDFWIDELAFSEGAVTASNCGIPGWSGGAGAGGSAGAAGSTGAAGGPAAAGAGGAGSP